MVLLAHLIAGGVAMIARAWRARATGTGAEAYRRHFIEAVLPAVRSIDGHRGAYLFRHGGDGDGDNRDDLVELEVVTLWESMDAIRRFAPDVEAAVVEPAAQALLRDFDATVRHKTVVVDTATGTP
jgi:heme-degrading monooxygenase HmoA